MVSVRSVRMEIFTDGGSDERELGQQRFHAVGGLDDVRAGLALDVQQSRRACRPTQPAMRTFSTLSITSPTSRRRTGEPFR